MAFGMMLYVIIQGSKLYVMHHFRRLLFYVLILISVQAFSQSEKHSCISPSHPGWLFTGLSPDKKTAYYIKASQDTERIDNGIKVWVLCDFKTKVLNKMTYENVESEALEIIDCTKKQERLIQSITYDSSGKILESIASDSEHQYVNTLPEIVRSEVIRKVNELYEK